MIHKKKFQLSIEMATFCPKYHEIILLWNQMIIKDEKDYDLPVQKYMPFKNMIEAFLRALK
jgi:hypothetical protein